MRQLVTLETISEINDIPGADQIEVAKVRGWNVVVKKGEFKVIQNNPLGIKGTDFRAFNLYKKTDDGPVVIPFDLWPAALVPLQVPVLPLSLPQTIDDIVEQADGIKSQISPQRLSEGIVWQGPKGFDFLGNRPGFKAISNKYLARQK